MHATITTNMVNNCNKSMSYLFVACIAFVSTMLHALPLLLALQNAENRNEKKTLKHTNRSKSCLSFVHVYECILLSQMILICCV